jgi:hypothetical protein
MKLTMATPWTKAEDQMFRDLVDGGVPAEDIAARLDRGINALKHRSYMLGLPRKWFKTQARNPS